MTLFHPYSRIHLAGLDLIVVKVYKYFCFLFPFFGGRGAAMYRKYVFFNM